MAAYNLVLYRLYIHLLTRAGFDKEKKYILATAEKDWYRKTTIERLIRKKTEENMEEPVYRIVRTRERDRRDKMDNHTMPNILCSIK